MPESKDTKPATRAQLIGALRQFIEDHEASGFYCAGLNAAWMRAKAVVDAEGGR